MRYHLGSLVAVFLALGLGIIIGITLNSDGKLVNEQAALLDAIEAQLTQLKTEKVQMEQDALKAVTDTAFYREFAEALLPSFITERLTGRSVAVITLNGGSGDKVVATLKEAGAQVGMALSGREIDLATVADKLVAAEVDTVVVVGENEEFDLGRRLVSALRQRRLQVVVAGAGTWAHVLAAPGAHQVLRVDTAVGLMKLVEQVAAAVEKE
ncbi:MAG: copper transporter [Kiritimatiellia bacterium]